jgi:transcriptional regulator with XRE-family HTH domain
MLGLSDTSTLSRWEHGISIPSTIQTFRLAHIYHTKPHELFNEVWNCIEEELVLLTHEAESVTNQSFYL